MRWKTHLVAAVLGASAFLIFGADGAFSESELDCEEAAATIASCCANFDVHQMNCINDGCAHKYQDLSMEESRCVRDKTCDYLREAGYCDLPTWAHADGGVRPVCQ